jgi:hypothetical protein
VKLRDRLRQAIVEESQGLFPKMHFNHTTACCFNGRLVVKVAPSFSTPVASILPAVSQLLFSSRFPYLEIHIRDALF